MSFQIRVRKQQRVHIVPNELPLYTVSAETQTIPAATPTVAAIDKSTPVGLIAAPEAPLTVRVAAYPSSEPLAEVTLPPGAVLADLRRAIRDAPDMAHRPERLFARWWASGPPGGGECGTERELPCAEGGGGLGADPPSLRSAGITEDYSLVLVGAGEGDGEEDPLVAALSAAAVADQRAEARDARVGRGMADLLAVIAGQAREISSLRRESKAQQEYLQNEVKELKTLIANGLRREEPPKRCGPLITVRTPCPPSVYTISYAANGAATVRGHEQYFQLPIDYEKEKNRPFHLPNAAVRGGDMCLVQFRITAKEGQNSGLAFGFTAASSECLSDPLHTYLGHPSAVVLELYGTELWCGTDQSLKLERIFHFNPKRCVAMLFHRTEPLKARVRIFVTEDGSFGETPKPYHEEAAEFALKAGTENVAYVPCGHVYDKTTLTIVSIAMNSDFPPQFIAHM